MTGEKLFVGHRNHRDITNIIFKIRHLNLFLALRFEPFDENHQRHSSIQLSANAHEILTDISVLTWTVRVSRLVAGHREGEAIELFKLMLLHGERPKHVMLLTVIRAVVAMNSEVLTKVIHSFVVTTGFDSVLSVVTHSTGPLFFALYCECFQAV